MKVASPLIHEKLPPTNYPEISSGKPTFQVVIVDYYFYSFDTKDGLSYIAPQKKGISLNKMKIARQTVEIVLSLGGRINDRREELF